MIYCFQCKDFKPIGYGSVGWCQRGSGKVRVNGYNFCNHAVKKEAGGLESDS